MKKRPKNLLKISEIAKQASVLPSTIRYYTDIGLLQASGQTPGGHRLYDKESTLATIGKIQFLNKQGMSMESIKKELAGGVNKRKILVIDDEPELGDLVTSLVNTSFPGCEVRVVFDGFKAGRVLSEYLPDLILLDLMLPGVNGFEVCQQIRSSDYFKGTRILAITGYDSEENKKKILDCGANAYLAKPMDVKELKEKISQLLEYAAAPREVSENNPEK
jgi:CheY-like chemotaxis protein